MVPRQAKFGLLYLAAALLVKRVRGLGIGVDVGVAASELPRYGCHPFLLGRKCRRSYGARPRTVCSIWGILVLASVRGLRTDVDVGANYLSQEKVQE
jgi:hypothetical protein